MIALTTGNASIINVSVTIAGKVIVAKGAHALILINAVVKGLA